MSLPEMLFSAGLPSLHPTPNAQNCPEKDWLLYPEKNGFGLWQWACLLKEPTLLMIPST